MIAKRWFLCVLMGWLTGCNNQYFFDDTTAGTDSSTGDTETIVNDTGSAIDTTDTGTAIGDTDSDTGTAIGDTDSDTGTAQPDTDTALLYENGFENGLPSNMDTDGDIGLSTTTVNSGLNSLQVAVNTTQTSAAISAEFAPIYDGSIYFRAHYYISDAPDDLTLNVMELLDEDWGNVVDVNLVSDLGFNLYFFEDDVTISSVSSIVEENQWFCLVSKFDISNGAGKTEVWINNTSVVVSGNNMNILPPTGIAVMRTGIVFSFSESGNVEIFVDDVLLSTAPIDC